MGAVALFPNCPHVTADTVPLSVVVAPRGRTLVAWVETARGWLILEDSTSHQHALDDGIAYAARHGLPFRQQNFPHATGGTPRPEKRGGSVALVPSERNGGSWDVLHVSADGDEMEIVGNAFRFEEAQAEAHRIAEAMGSRFDDDAGPGAA